MRVLGLETSCDETAAAVLECTGTRAEVRADIVHSQVRMHAVYGGVVPELASRDHLARVLPVLDEALRQAGCSVSEIDLFAVTSGPGLVGALLVGVQVAKALAWSLSKPVVGTNHLSGHAFAIQLSESRPEFPYLALVASGGHTALYDVQAPDVMAPIGHTLDDAAGEAFDKVGKMLGLDYPAGAVIDGLAKSGDRARHAFPRALKMRASFDFSFSGVKTAVLQHLDKHGIPTGQDLNDLCASFQEAVCDSLVTKALRAAQAHGLARVVLGGGVAANSRLRQLLQERGTAAGLQVFVPPVRLCTDNGAMIALAGAYRYQHRGADALSLNADAAWRI
jgi:N6-L-threonylcarbamoyladenine synthase